MRKVASQHQCSEWYHEGFKDKAGILHSFPLTVAMASSRNDNPVAFVDLHCLISENGEGWPSSKSIWALFKTCAEASANNLLPRCSRTQMFCLGRTARILRIRAVGQKTQRLLQRLAANLFAVVYLGISTMRKTTEIRGPCSLPPQCSRGGCLPHTRREHVRHEHSWRLPWVHTMC